LEEFEEVTRRVRLLFEILLMSAQRFALMLMEELHAALKGLQDFWGGRGTVG